MSKQNTTEYIVSSVVILMLVIIVFNINILNETIGFIPILNSIKEGKEIIIGRNNPIVLCQLFWSMIIEKIISNLNKGSDKIMYKITEKIVIGSISVMISSFTIVMLSKALIENLHIQFSYIGPALLILTIGVILLTIKISDTSKEVMLKLFISVFIYLSTLKVVPDVDALAKTLLIALVSIFIPLLGIRILFKSIL